jgi:hypothetical protein
MHRSISLRPYDARWMHAMDDEDRDFPDFKRALASCPDPDYAFMTDTFKLALTRCQDPDHCAILEKRLQAWGRIATRPYPGSLLEHWQDIKDGMAASSVATVYEGIAQSSRVHAAKMNERNQRPELREAIIAVLSDDHGPAVAEEAWKKAGLILGKVNAWLRKHGHKPTKQKGVYDQINKLYFPRNVDTFLGT